MTLRYEALLAHCLAKPGAWPDKPWHDDVVAKVGDRIFAFLGSPGPGGEAALIGVKCGRDRLEAGEWLERYPDDAAAMAYIGRFGWNRLRAGGAIPVDELLEAVDASYDDVVARLPRSRRPSRDG